MRTISVEQELQRVSGVAVCMMLALGFLLFVLWRMQIGRGWQYQSSHEQQSVRRIRVPAQRGTIMDRNGERLAENQPCYGIAIYLEELRQAGPRGKVVDRACELIARMAALTGLEPQLARSQIETHLVKRKPLPLVAWRNVGEPAMARLAESSEPLPGVDILVEARRAYPQGALAAHLLGTIGRADAPDTEEDEEARYNYYLPDMEGRGGLEKKYNDRLAGKAGGRLVRVDVSGYRFDDLSVREARRGGDLRLAVDVRIQRLAETLIADTAGAVVVMDPRNGDVLALCSSPAFDPNAFSPAIPAGLWNALRQDPRLPLLNRAVDGAYAPGSTFKPFVALAALQSGKADSHVAFLCPGYFNLGGHQFRCHQSVAHGRVDLVRALEVSCNVFFCQLGLQCGVENIVAWASGAGVGRKTGIELDHESAGLLPDPAWKQKKYREGWWDGDTCNLSIGQGALLVTPLQMAVATAVIANGGLAVRPRLVLGVREPGEAAFREVPPEPANRLNLDSSALDRVREGMRAVIHSPSGTGARALVPGVLMAGKTGTAEYGLKGEHRQHGWMVVFAPFYEPRVVAVMMMDEAVSGGISVGPRLQKLMSGIFALPDLQDGG
ncbi:MAG: penicillin-binding protein 2 [Lentisphaerae bacterium]|nr:penicillin-binding protein 2 [Lentisphaerota bacterium]